MAENGLLGGGERDTLHWGRPDRSPNQLRLTTAKEEFLFAYPANCHPQYHHDSSVRFPKHGVVNPT